MEMKKKPVDSGKLTVAQRMANHLGRGDDISYILTIYERLGGTFKSEKEVNMEDTNYEANDDKSPESVEGAETPEGILNKNEESDTNGEMGTEGLSKKKEEKKTPTPLDNVKMGGRY